VACPACEAVNPLDELVCRVCGKPMLDLLHTSEPLEHARRPGVAVGLSVVPGLGCWYAGSLGQGLTRLLLWFVQRVVAVVALPRPGPAMLLVKVVSRSAWWACGRCRRWTPGGWPRAGGRWPTSGPGGGGGRAGLGVVLALGLVVTVGLERDTGAPGEVPPETHARAAAGGRGSLTARPAPSLPARAERVGRADPVA
jgi:hypothetical protein